MKIKSCKLNKVETCNEKDSIIEVAKKLRDKKERSLIVINNRKNPIGIISTVDISNRAVAEGKDLKKTIAEQIMTSPIMTRDINELLSQTYVSMIKENLFSIPITEKGRIKGILEIKEAMNTLSNRKK